MVGGGIYFELAFIKHCVGFEFELEDKFGKQFSGGPKGKVDGQPNDFEVGHVKLEVSSFGQEIEVDNVGGFDLHGGEAT